MNSLNTSLSLFVIITQSASPVALQALLQPWDCPCANGAIVQVVDK